MTCRNFHRRISSHDLNKPQVCWSDSGSILFCFLKGLHAIYHGKIWVKILHVTNLELRDVISIDKKCSLVPAVLKTPRIFPLFSKEVEQYPQSLAGEPRVGMLL